MSTLARHQPQSARAAQNEQAAKVVGWHLIAGIVIGILFFAFFMGLMEWVHDNGRGVVRFDHSILIWLHGHQRPGLTEAARALAFMGSPYVMVTVACAATLAGFVSRPVRGAAWTFPVAIIGGGLIIQCVKLAVHRTRPDLFQPLLHESGYSFPSGHSLIAVTIYGLIGYFIVHLFQNRAARTLVTACTVLIILAIGISRPYVGVHYPTDVLAGWAAGIPWLITCLGLHEIMSRRWSKAGEPVLNLPPERVKQYQDILAPRPEPRSS